MKTICYVLSLLAVVAGLASAAWKRWPQAAFWMSLAIWLTLP
jgi:hypothetical protein